MPARIASVRARFVVLLTRFDERETDQRLALWTRAKGKERCRQTDFRHRMSLAPIRVAGMAQTSQASRTSRNQLGLIITSTHRDLLQCPQIQPQSFSNLANGLGSRPLPDFENLGFLLSALGTSEYAALKPRFTGVDLPQRHRRRALRTCEAPQKARESHEEVRTLGYGMCWQVLPSCLQAGVLQNSQPPTPDQRSLSVMNLQWALIGHIASRLSTVGMCIRPTIVLCTRTVG
jgi:hypothetical protein